MRQLEKISISNVRRFSENVEITVGKGATVFLAPNGTGKTAIFEAIELALTGRVKRLPFPPDALIRDSKDESKIRLDFDSGKYCETLFRKGVEPVLMGDHGDIFSGLPVNDVAFLLRLTHLLNQRGSDWLVQSQSDAAADQLDHLAIGKDALRVNELIPSAKRQANSVLDAANRQLEEVKKSLELWQNLLGKRAQSNVQTEGKIVPLKDLLRKLNLIGESQSIPAINTNSIDVVIGHQVVVQKLLEKQKDTNQQKLLLVNVGDQLILEHNETQGLLQQANENLAKTRESKRGIAKEINLLQEQFILKTNLLQSHEEVLVRLITLHNQTLLLDNTKKDILSSEDQRKTTQERLQNALSLQVQLTVQYDKRKRIWDLNQDFREQSVRAAEDRATALSNTNALSRWTTIISNIEELTAESAALLSNVEITQNQVTITSKDLDEAINSKNIIERNFDALTSSADDVKNAISIIAGKMSPELNECPLCLNSYPDGELQTRVKRALENINPVLKQTAELLELERGRVKKLVEANDAANSALSVAKRLYDENRRGIENHNLDLAKNYVGVIYNASSINEAARLHDEALKNLSLREKELDEIGEGLKLEAIEPLGPIEDRLQQNANDIATLTDKLQALSRQISEQNSSRNAIELILQGQEQIEGLDEKIPEQENLVSQSKNELDILSKSQENQQRLLNQTNAILESQEDASSQLSTRLSNTITRWQAVGLQGIPDRTVLQTYREGIENTISGIAVYLTEITSVADELLKLKTYEEQFQAEREIALIRADRSEAEYAAILHERFTKANQRIIDCSRKISTLNSLANNITSQLDNINERISSINPLWGKLLKRIVLDPRFADTKLVSYTHYRKQHADVNVTLHGKDYVAAQIASEAQITDLQFTFLLSMAQKYQWSPWRALLLDDPTQHHDLVHASAVFDLLRDYIMDQHFQILLATHDSTHANFFVRKLENDGIPTKLWKLQVTADGVNAVLS